MQINSLSDPTSSKKPLVNTIREDILTKPMKNHLEWAKVFNDLLFKHFREKLVSVVVYGSVAIGAEKENSDIDLLLVIQNIQGGRFQRRKFIDPIYLELERLFPNETFPFFSTLIKTPEEAKKLSPLYFDMTDRRQILTDQNCFMKNILEEVNRRLKKLGARREKIGKVEYWNLKPDYKPGEVFEI